MTFNFNHSDISKIYTAKRDGCRCGCMGKYYEMDSENPVERKKAELLFETIKVIVETNAFVEIDNGGDIYLNVTINTGRVYTMYFNKI